MKLTLQGHNDLYAVEQLQLSLFPEGAEGEAVSSLHRGNTWLTASAKITAFGKTVTASRRIKAAEETVRARRRALQQSYYMAATQLLDSLPPWGALAGAFLAPFLFGLYWKKTTKAAVWSSFLFSTVVMLSNIFFGRYFPSLLQTPINAGVFCMFAGLVMVPVVSLFTKKTDKAHVEQVFSCYNCTVTVCVTDSIGDTKEEK